MRERVVNGLVVSLTFIEWFHVKCVILFLFLSLETPTPYHSLTFTLLGTQFLLLLLQIKFNHWITTTALFACPPFHQELIGLIDFPALPDLSSPSLDPACPYAACWSLAQLNSVFQVTLTFLLHIFKELLFSSVCVEVSKVSQSLFCISLRLSRVPHLSPTKSFTLWVCLKRYYINEILLTWTTSKGDKQHWVLNTCDSPSFIFRTKEASKMKGETSSPVAFYF